MLAPAEICACSFSSHLMPGNVQSRIAPGEAWLVPMQMLRKNLIERERKRQEQGKGGATAPGAH